MDAWKFLSLRQCKCCVISLFLRDVDGIGSPLGY